MTKNHETKAKKGFAAMDPEQLRRIASAGGIARREAYKAARRNKQASQSGSTLGS